MDLHELSKWHLLINISNIPGLDKIGRLKTYMKTLSHLQVSGAQVASGGTLGQQDVGSDLACHAVGKRLQLRSPPEGHLDCKT